VCRTVNIRDANLFHHRVVNCWNKLPDSVVLATSTSSFKTRLSKFLNTVGSQCSVCVLCISFQFVCITVLWLFSISIFLH